MGATEFTEAERGTRAKRRHLVPMTKGGWERVALCQTKAGNWFPARPERLLPLCAYCYRVWLNLPAGERGKWHDAPAVPDLPEGGYYVKPPS